MNVHTPCQTEAPFPDQSTIPKLLGKSNFDKWYSAMVPALQSNERARMLIFGGHHEPSKNRHQSSEISISTSIISFQGITPLPSSRRVVGDSLDLADIESCRFIRTTLAMNVVPFVRGQHSAKSLWERLNYLYGESAGIDVQAGSHIVDTGGSSQINSNQSKQTSRRPTLFSATSNPALIVLTEAEKEPCRTREELDTADSPKRRSCVSHSGAVGDALDHGMAQNPILEFSSEEKGHQAYESVKIQGEYITSSISSKMPRLKKVPFALPLGLLRFQKRRSNS